MGVFGNNSPSFVIAIVVAIIAVAGYAAWQAWRPNPVRQSDRITRKFARDSRDLVRSHRRALRAIKRDVDPQTDNAARIEAAIKRQTEAAIEALEGLAEDAEARLDEMDGISLRTLRNRVGRVRKRREEARTMIYEEASHARSELQRGTNLPRGDEPGREVVSLPTPAS